MSRIRREGSKGRMRKEVDERRTRWRRNGRRVKGE